MKAAFILNDHCLEVQDTPQPKPNPTEVLIKVAYCGICGTDLHWLAAGMLPTGSIIGHEISGIVAEVGSKVTGWAPGDAVAVMPLDPCGHCGPCRRGKSQLCEEIIARSYGLGRLPGGFAQYMVVQPSMLFKVPNDMDMKLAALSEPWAVASHGVNLSNLSKKDDALIMGAGPIGLLTAYALKARGAGKITITEPDSWRAKQAHTIGVDAVIEPSQVNAQLAFDQDNENRPEFIFDCAGTGSSLDEAVGIVRSGGRIVVLGIHLGGNIAFSPLLWLYKEITVSYSLGYSREEFGESVQQLINGAVNPDGVISDVFSLASIDGAFKALNKPGQSKILIDCQDV